MDQRRFSGLMVSCLCFLFLLSACSTIPGIGGGSPASQPTATATTASATPQETPAATPTQASSVSLEQVDWNNFTYTFSCFTGSPVQVKMKDGQADQNGVHYTVQKPVFGDLNNDGQPEAVILYHCEGGGTSPQLVYVYTGTAQHPTLMATLPGNGDNKLATVNQALVAAGILQLVGYGYSANVPLCCPDLLVTSTYKWMGQSFLLVTSNAIKRPPNS